MNPPWKSTSHAKHLALLATLALALIACTSAGASTDDGEPADDRNEVVDFIETARQAPACTAEDLGPLLGVTFELVDDTGPYLIFEAGGHGDVARYELRQPGNGATGPGILIAHLEPGRVTGAALRSTLDGAQTKPLGIIHGANPPLAEESFTSDGTELFATRTMDDPSEVRSLSWHCN